jgi:DNA-binding MarR family transcriptional regulator
VPVRSARHRWERLWINHRRKQLTPKLFRDILFVEFNVQVRNSQFEKSLLNKIARVANSLEREVESELKVSFALTFSQFRLLDGLAVLGEASQRELAGYLSVTPAVVTRQVEALGARGLVIQRPHPKSKRENVIALTDRGKQAVGEAAALMSRRQKELFERLSVQDEAAFKRGIDGLLKVIA